MLLYRALELGYYILNRSKDLGYTLTSMELQFIVYYTELLYYNRYGERILSSDYENTQVGPLQVELYDELRVYVDSELPYVESYDQLYVDLETLEVCSREKYITELEFNSYVDASIDEVLSYFSTYTSGWDMLEEYNKEITDLSYSLGKALGCEELSEHGDYLGIS